MKTGDKVRFISEKGGGTITGFQGKNTVLVEDEDGFEIPMLRNEVVVIDEEKEGRFLPKEKERTLRDEDAPEFEPCERPITFRAKPVERAGGNVLKAVLAVVHSVHHERLFDLYLVNDSNYELQAQLLRRQGEGWVVAWKGKMQPNTKQQVHEMDIDEVNDWEYLCVQLLASKEERVFALQPVVSTEVRLQPIRYTKESTFQRSPFFNLPAWVEELC